MCLVSIAPNPQLAFLDVTNLCNLKCMFCYQNDNLEANRPKLENLLQIQSILAANDCKEIIYLGGEPTIYPHIADLLINGNKLNIHQAIITNGQKLTLDLVKLFQELPNFKLGISFHDYREAVYEKVSCVKGSYRNVIKTMDLIDNAGIAWYTQTSILKDNYLRLYD